MKAMLFLIISMCATPICLVLLVGMLAAYKRRCDMHPEVFEPAQKED
jgi:hypothetical protein